MVPYGATESELCCVIALTEQAIFEPGIEGLKKVNPFGFVCVCDEAGFKLLLHLSAHSGY